MSVGLAIAACALLMAAAWRDIATRTIPNSLGVLLLGVGVLARTREGPSAFAFSTASALLLSVLLLLVYSRGLIGGGDAKLMAALAVGLSPLDCYRFAIATALAGGALAVAYLLGSRCVRKSASTRRMSLLGRVAAVEAWRIRKRAPLPYGVAIAAGGVLVLFQTGSP
jgi:prepilin peptidase CpaA